jgi:hypothetical protein
VSPFNQAFQNDRTISTFSRDTARQVSRLLVPAPN